MQLAWFNILKRIYIFLRDGQMPYFLALLCFALVGWLVFLVGGSGQTESYNSMEAKVKIYKDDVRVFSKELANRNVEINQLRIKNKLNEKIIESLQRRFNALEKKSLEKEEITETYKRILLGKLSQGSVIIYGLEINPTANNDWNINAILTRFERKKKFKGSFYFNITTEEKEGNRLQYRLPEEKNIAIEFVNHLEVDETVSLSASASIVELNLVVLDNKGKEVVSETLILDDVIEASEE